MEQEFENCLAGQFLLGDSPADVIQETQLHACQLFVVSWKLGICCQLQCLLYWCLQHGRLKRVVLPTYWASQAEFLVNKHSKRLKRKLHGLLGLSRGSYSVLFSQNFLYKTITCLPELRKGDTNSTSQREEQSGRDFNAILKNYHIIFPEWYVCLQLCKNQEKKNILK